jgi:acyl carrier protein
MPDKINLRTQVSQDDEVLNKIKTFVFESGWGYTLPFPFLFKRKPITRETTIEEDLKITGDDSDEFLIAFGKEFKVNVSDFKIGDYFGSEGDPVLRTLNRILSRGKKRSKKTLTIGHLEKAVLAGKLDEEVINS